MRISKRARIEPEVQNDMISQLPESVLVEILSRMPTLDAVKMASFSRFRNLWAGVRCLSFDDCAFHEHEFRDDNEGPNYDERFLNLIRRVLILHERDTIDEFHLKFGFNLFYVINEGDEYQYDDDGYVSKVKRMASELTGWIQFSLKKQVKVLDIDLLGCESPDPDVNYELPSSLLNNDYLMDLSLSGCGIMRGRIQLVSLTKLSLKQINLSDEIMGKIFQGCPKLEEVSLNQCCGFSKLNMINHNLESLKIYFGYRNQFEVEISCPNIKSLQLSGSIRLAHLKAPCKVSRASLYFSHDFNCECRAYGKLLIMLRTLVNANEVVLCTSTALVFTIWEFLGKGQKVHVFRWKSLEFRLLFTKWHLPGVWSILKSSILLQTLTFNISPGSHHIFSTDEAEWIEVYDFEGEDYLKLRECSFPFLKTVTIYGYVTQPFVFELIEFLLKNASVLERMVISLKKTFNESSLYEVFEQSVVDQNIAFSSNELLEFSQKLLSLPRASKSAIIQFCY